PEGYFAGKLIEDAGLKGFRVGEAQVSEKHAGFVINRGGASAAQVRALIEEVQRQVLENSGVKLEREVIYLGEFV
ncbi:MAG TPA: UDP-N-acetylenolpyruvoylglucosamine reductase, partial [Lachnospiraceae bacterium]|nr:UDP-N-acetylenolpyruvoylglucosamine reductase [Lachnospiraceae bacterium]